VADLKTQGVNVNLCEEGDRVRTALIKACRHGHISIVELLLACNGQRDSVKLLLRSGQIQNCRTVREEQFLKK
jgi:ankyrin repeat protein